MQTGSYAARFEQEEAEHRKHQDIVAQMEVERRQNWENSIGTAKVAFVAGKTEYPVSPPCEIHYRSGFLNPISFCRDSKERDELEAMARAHGLFVRWDFQYSNTTYDLGTNYTYRAVLVKEDPRPVQWFFRRLSRLLGL